MTRRTRGWTLTATGIVAITIGVTIPWVLIWAPGILLVIVGYGYITGPERDERPGYITDPWKDKRP